MMLLEPIPLFLNKKELFSTLLLFFILFLISLGYEYHNYKKIVSKPLHVSNFTKVLNHYEKRSKNGKKYDVFKLKSAEGYGFYTVSWKKRDIKTGDTLKVGFNTKKLTFIDYLKGFFAPPLFIVKLKSYEKSIFDNLKEFIKKQHNSKIAKEVFSALFLATPVSKETREKIQKLGISHLIAISGFHLGFLGAVLFFALKIPYTFLQERFFPYRNRKFDLTLIVFSILFLYMYMLDFTPSLLRSFVMGVFGFFLYDRNIKILSFENLLISALFIIVLFPKLIFSISFWFSLCGVFYIFLFLHHFSKLNKIFLFILLNLWVFVAMLPIIHSIFPTFTVLQFLSPILSMLFSIFYPLALILHIFDLGSFLDFPIEWLLDLNAKSYQITTPTWYLICYVVLSLASMRSKNLAFFVFISAIGVLFI